MLFQAEYIFNVWHLLGTGISCVQTADDLREGIQIQIQMKPYENPIENDENKIKRERERETMAKRVEH